LTSIIVWELRGSRQEKDYYGNHVKQLLESIFKELTFEPKFRSGGKNGCFGIQTSKRIVCNFFLEHGFNPGRKTHTVHIPEYIMNSNRKIQSAFIRGLFDTDGHMRFDRINHHREYNYPKIELCFASIRLRDNLFVLLNKLGYRVQKWGKKYYSICIAGFANMEKFMKEVSPKNTKHLNKYKFFKEHGYCKPNAAVA
jgi:hypothetical protein